MRSTLVSIMSALSIIAGVFFAVSVKTDIGILCSIIIIQIGFIMSLLSDIQKNTKKSTDNDTDDKVAT